MRDMLTRSTYDNLDDVFSQLSMLRAVFQSISQGDTGLNFGTAEIRGLCATLNGATEVLGDVLSEASVEGTTCHAA